MPDKKISDEQLLPGSSIDHAADLIPIVDMSEVDSLKNKKTTVDELKIVFQASDATETQKGIVELAELNESKDEADNTVAITPKALRASGGGMGVPISRTLTDSDTLVSTDVNKRVIFNIGSAKNCTIPSATFAAGDTIFIERTGAGQLTFVAGGGMTLTSSLGALTDAGVNNIVTLLFTSTSACSIYNGVPNTSVPSSRTIAGLDLTTNRSASELMIAMGVILSNILRGSTHNRFHGSSLAVGLSSLGTAALPVNSLRASPFIVGRELTLDRIQAEVTTPGTSAKLRLGVYADNNGYPGALLVDSGELDAGSTGVKTATINLTIQPGLYWLACLGGTASATYRAEGSTCFWPSVSGYNSAMGGIIRQPYWVVAQTYGALPNPFTASGSINNTGTNIPIILVRA